MYPTIFRCVACNTCTKSCPQGLQVMDYVQAAMRGDIAEVMDLSFDCVSCGLCMLRCPAEITQHKVGILWRRLYGRYLRKESPELDARIEPVEDGDLRGRVRRDDVDEQGGFEREVLRRDIEE